MSLQKINKIQLAVLCLMLIYSCAAVRNTTDGSSYVEYNGRMVHCDIEGKQFTFPLDEEYPVLKQGVSDKTQAEYRKWSRLAVYYVTKYAPQSDYILFTVPGLVIACVEDSAGRNDIRPEIDLDVDGSLNPAIPAVNKRDTTYWPFDFDRGWTSPEPKKGMKGRSTDWNIRTKADILVDHILLGNGRMLALIYPVDGKEHYRRGTDGKYDYSYAGYSTLWDTKKDKLMSYKYVRRKCDVLTFKVVQAVMRWL